MELHQLKRIIEAALLAASHPLTLPQISSLFDELAMPSQESLARAMAELQADTAERGIELVEVASGFRYQVRQDVHPHITRLWSERPSRYSRALLETLALIAYRQPITRAEIEQIRGVAVSTNIIRTLEDREWVRIIGYRDLPGKPALFGTTRQFLDYFNLQSLDQLPALGELRDLDEDNSQLLDMNGVVIPAHIDTDNGDSTETDAEGAESGDHDDAPLPDPTVADAPEEPSNAADDSDTTEHLVIASDDEAPSLPDAEDENDVRSGNTTEPLA